MKKYHFLFVIVVSLWMSFASADSLRADIVSDGDGIIIYLDAGHDSTHAGCQKNGLKEEELNLKIAKYCKEKLEQYEGVTVYMSRKGMKCPYLGSDSVVDNTSRVEDAAKKNATLYVSIHNNYVKKSDVNGVTVFYPNSNYNKKIGKIGKEVAQSVQNALVKVGLNDRGLSLRMTEDDTRYPDDSKADYYNVIKTSKLHGFPGIIIEHAYMSSKFDVSHFLNSDAKLKKLGEADAKGIATYYGLKKKKETRVNLKKVTQEAEEAVTITWSVFDGADSYVVLRRELLSKMKSKKDPVYSDWEVIGNTKKTKFTDDEFEIGKTYYYTVQAHMEDTDCMSKKNAVGFSVTTK